MKKVYNKVNTLDKRSIKKYSLSEDILMEHAAYGIFNFIKNKFKNKSKILIACGSGNNGADGIALARLLQGKYKITIYLPYKLKSTASKKQYERIKNLNIKIITTLNKNKTYKVIVDCLFGSGIHGILNNKNQKIIQILNKYRSYKIACDIPSGINTFGQLSPISFKADTTITMGALKASLFSDNAKDFVGKIKIINLGIHKKYFQTNTNLFLLNKNDLNLPIRKINSSHKGNFGHLSIFTGEHKGASILACEAAFKFGCGLITILSNQKINNIKNFIMQNNKMPSNTTAIAIGMGMGKKINFNLLNNKIPKIIDADLFYNKKILTLLEQKKNVLTPHPKEFCSLLKICKIADLNTIELQNNRFKYIKMFGEKYPKIVLLLKGANTLIIFNNIIYINNLGKPSLSKGGSGDVLSGLIGSLLAQNYSPIDAAISGSLAHSIASRNYKKNNYSLTPSKLITQITKI